MAADTANIRMIATRISRDVICRMQDGGRGIPLPFPVKTPGSQPGGHNEVGALLRVMAWISGPALFPFIS
jgi:hypothetical protein